VDGLNLYAFVKGNPVAHIDEEGMMMTASKYSTRFSGGSGGYYGKRTYLTVTQRKGVKEEIEKWNVKLKVQINAKCMDSGTDLDWQRKTKTTSSSFFSRMMDFGKNFLTGATVSVFEYPPTVQQFKEQISKGPVTVTSWNLALPGSLYEKHHRFVVLGEKEGQLLNMDKDDTIFTRTKEDFFKSLYGKYSENEIGEFFSIIEATNAYAKENIKSLQDLTHDELMKLNVWVLWGRLESTEEFVQRLRRYEYNAVIRKPNPDKFITPMQDKRKEEERS
jgi:hypothetical protein